MAMVTYLQDFQDTSYQAMLLENMSFQYKE